MMIQAYAQEKITVCSVSQYTFSEFGSSACTPISCYMVSKLLPLLDACVPFSGEEVMTDAVLNGVQTLSDIYGGSANPAEDARRHWSCEEFMASVENLRSSLNQVSSSIQGVLTDNGAFRDVGQRAREFANGNGFSERYVGIIITKPPETVCVFIPPGKNTDIGRGHSPLKYYLYDPHSRPQLGLSGSYLVESEDGAAIVNRLKELFPALPADQYDDIGAEANLMNMMYNSFESSFFVSAAQLAPTAAPNNRPVAGPAATACLSAPAPAFCSTSSSSAGAEINSSSTRSYAAAVVSPSDPTDSTPAQPVLVSESSCSAPMSQAVEASRSRVDSASIVEDDFVLVDSNTPVDPSSVDADTDANRA
jgi:hypothetical protein